MQPEILRALLLSIFIPIAGLKVFNFSIQFYKLLLPSIRSQLQSLYLSASVDHPHDFY